jgi:hypothetical protein
VEAVLKHGGSLKLRIHLSIEEKKECCCIKSNQKCLRYGKSIKKLRGFEETLKPLKDEAER